MDTIYSEIIGRMKEAAGLKNDSAVAKSIGVTPQALSNYKKRGHMPSSLIIKFAGINDISVDWLLSGDGKKHTTAYKKTPEDLAYSKILGGMPAHLCPIEITYLGKLLGILRSPNRAIADATKYCIDSLHKTDKQYSAYQEQTRETSEPIQEHKSEAGTA